MQELVLYFLKVHFFHNLKSDLGFGGDLIGALVHLAYNARKSSSQNEDMSERYAI